MRVRAPRQGTLLVFVAALAGFAFVEAGLGRSLIHGDEALAFLAVLAAGLVVEGGWYAVRGTNAISPRST